MRNSMARSHSWSARHWGWGAVLAIAGSCWCGCSRTPSPKKTDVANAGIPAACSSNNECPASVGPCTSSRCDHGRCILSTAPAGTRCPLELAFAQRQADLVSSELNEYGVCCESSCMPRLLCMQHCGEKLAKAIRPTVPTYPCADTRDCTPLNLDSAAVARAEAGLAHCLIECGFPTPEALVSEPPKRVPDPRPPQPVPPEPE